MRICGYWLDITSPSGQRIRQTTGTAIKQQAQELHDKLKAELWDLEKLNKKPERLFDEALLLFLQEAEQQKDFETKRRHAIYWRAIFSGRGLNSISGEDIQNNLPTHSTQSKQALSKSTQNRYRTSIMRVMSIAHKNGWLHQIPYVKKNEEPKVRVRWITRAEALNLIENLRLPWMKNVCSFALLTGARMNEILSLTWDKIDFMRKIAIVSNEVAKSGKARALPLNDGALKLLRGLTIDEGNSYVFHRNTKKTYWAY